ncbi:MAG: hypothetical protein R3E91_02615 [Chlamydiales bacterium]
MKPSFKVFFAALSVMSILSLGSCSRWADSCDPCGWKCPKKCDGCPSPCAPKLRCEPNSPKYTPNCSPQQNCAPCSPGKCPPKCAPRSS